MIERLLRQRSLRGQLVAVLMIISATVLLIASLSLVVWDYLQFRGDMRRQLSIQSLMVLENSTAAMSFDDPVAARDTLQTLSRNSDIRSACLYQPSGPL